MGFGNIIPKENLLKKKTLPLKVLTNKKINSNNIPLKRPFIK
jgi:hypothetical protein